MKFCALPVQLTLLASCACTVASVTWPRYWANAGGGSRGSNSKRVQRSAKQNFNRMESLSECNGRLEIDRVVVAAQQSADELPRDDDAHVFDEERDELVFLDADPVELGGIVHRAERGHDIVEVRSDDAAARGEILKKLPNDAALALGESAADEHICESVDHSVAAFRHLELHNDGRGAHRGDGHVGGAANILAALGHKIRHGQPTELETGCRSSG